MPYPELSPFTDKSILSWLRYTISLPLGETIVIETTIPQSNVFGSGTSENLKSHSTLEITATRLIDAVYGGNIPLSRIVSRELNGRDVKAELVRKWNLSSEIAVIVATGRVGQITLKSGKMSIEIVPKIVDLKTEARYTTTGNCMNSLGVGKCTLDKQKQELRLSTASANTVTVVGALPTISANTTYGLAIGDDMYFVSAFVGQVLYLDREISGVPLSGTLQRYCNRSYNQCKAYNNVAQYSGNPFLTNSSYSAS